MCFRRALPVTAAALAALVAAARGELSRAEHPFMFWNRRDLAAIRQRVQTQRWAKQAFERLGNEPDKNARPLGRLLKYALTGDETLQAAERKDLLRVINSPVPRGGAQWLTILRYDLLYDKLTAGERKAFEEMARVYIRNAVFDNAVFDPKIFNDSRNYSRYDARKYTRTNWLPNITWPRKVSANLFAAALRDEQLIRRTWAHYGSWKWYFDEYLCDSGFYSEEFSKMGSTPGAMLVYCLAVERLGLGELGFGYRGKGGATMRAHVESLIHLGYPRIDLGSDRPQYPMVTIGDLRQTGSSQAHNLPSPAFQHSLVVGYVPSAGAGGEPSWRGGNLLWRAHGAWGGMIRGRHAQWDGYGPFTPKMQIPLWFELAARRWPDGGFAYFLARMRPPGASAYEPTLHFGLEPVEPAAAKPPPAPSAVWPQRGLVMLRAEESPAYWDSPAPAVCLRLATNYAHNVHDAFALAGYYAFHRPIHLNRQVTPGYANGWSRSIQSHCGLTVDGAEPKFTDATTVRHAFGGPVKYVAAESDRVYPGVTLRRTLLLTREYLVDATRAVSAEPHDYTWIVHTLGRLRAGGARRAPREPVEWQDAALPDRLRSLAGVRRFDAHTSPWFVTADQVCTLADASKAKLPRSWYDRKVGVRIHMSGEAAGTEVYAAPTPAPRATTRGKDGKRTTVERPSEVGGETLLACRRAPSTTFAAVHEPFEAGRPRIETVRYFGASSGGIGLAVTGGGVNDRVMLSFSSDRAAPYGYTGGGEELRFVDYLHVRIRPEAVVVTTRRLLGLKLRIAGRPKLLVNGKEAPSRLAGGVLTLAGGE